MEGTKLLDKFKLDLARTESQREAGKKLGQNTTKLKNRSKYYRKVIQNLERNVEAINKLKTHTYYSIVIAHSGSNVRHTAIMYVRFDIRDVIIFNPTYETMSEGYCIEDIHYFDILRELTEMNQRVY